LQSDINDSSSMFFKKDDCNGQNWFDYFSQQFTNNPYDLFLLLTQCRYDPYFKSFCKKDVPNDNNNNDDNMHVPTDNNIERFVSHLFHLQLTKKFSSWQGEKYNFFIKPNIQTSNFQPEKYHPRHPNKICWIEMFGNCCYYIPQKTKASNCEDNIPKIIQQLGSIQVNFTIDGMKAFNEWYIKDDEKLKQFVDQCKTLGYVTRQNDQLEIDQKEAQNLIVWERECLRERIKKYL